MVVQRSRLGVHGWWRKVLLVYWLALAIVSETMCRGVNVGENEVSSKHSAVDVQKSRTHVGKELYLMSAQETSSNSSIRHRLDKIDLSPSLGLDFHKKGIHVVSRIPESSSERLQFVGSHLVHGGGEESRSIIHLTQTLWNASSSEPRLQGDEKVPRVMLQLYDSNVKNKANLAPYQADTVRCFPALFVHNDSVLEASDSRGFEGRPDEGRPGEGRPDEGRPDEGRPGEGRPGEGNSSSQTFKFQLKLPKGEHVRNLLLRLHAIVKRKQSPVGLEGRMRVSLVRCSEVPSELSHQPCRDVDLAWKDVYLHNHSWLSFSIRGALEHVQRLPNELLTLRIQVERIFQTVGDPGKLRVDDSHDIDLQPLVLLYTTQHRLQKARQRRSLTEVDWEGFEEDLDSEDEIALASESDRSGRRAGRRRRTKNACKRKPLRVDFASIGWSDWVIAPTHYEAYQCSGKCFYPLASHLSPTKHAVIQTLMHSKSTDRARRACCVPTKLGPISLLYKEDGVMTFKKEYDGMVALECGCR